jgi:hypothetical protein
VTTLNDIRFECANGDMDTFGGCDGKVGNVYKFSSIIFTSDTTFYYATTTNIFEMSLTQLPPAK